jgi:hypothetical protein
MAAHVVSGRGLALDPFAASELQPLRRAVPEDLPARIAQAMRARLSERSRPTPAQLDAWLARWLGEFAAQVDRTGGLLVHL